MVAMLNAKKCIICSAVIMLLVLSSADLSESSNRFILLWEEPEGDSYFLDSESIYFEKGIYRFWYKWVWSEKTRKKMNTFGRTKKEKQDISRVKYSMCCKEFNPSNRMAKVISIIDYSVEGDVVFSTDYRNLTTWEYLVPGSIGESISESVLYFLQKFPDKVKN